MTTTKNKPTTEEPRETSQPSNAAEALAERERKLKFLAEQAKHEGVPPISTTALATIRRHIGFELPPGIKAALKRVALDWDAALAGVLANTYDQGRAAFARQEAAAAAAAANDTTALNAMDHWTQTELCDEHLVRMKHFKQVQRVQSQKAFEIAQPYFKKFTAAIGDLAEQIATQEEAVANTLGLTFGPSSTVKQLRRAVFDITTREETMVKGTFSAKPSTICEGLIDFEP